MEGDELLDGGNRVFLARERLVQNVDDGDVASASGFVVGNNKADLGYGVVVWITRVDVGLVWAVHGGFLSLVKG